jgi:hypothetical protein
MLFMEIIGMNGTELTNIPPLSDRARSGTRGYHWTAEGIGPLLHKSSASTDCVFEFCSVIYFFLYFFMCFLSLCDQLLFHSHGLLSRLNYSLSQNYFW